jgi:uncharacterized membrane protein
MTERSLGTARYDPTFLETRIARLLIVGTGVGVTLLGIGIVLMLLQGVDPLATPAVAFRPDTIAVDVLALRPEGFLWSGLLVVMALPVTRVAVAAAAFLRHGDRVMALIALSVLVVLAVSVLLAEAEPV